MPKSLRFRIEYLKAFTRRYTVALVIGVFVATVAIVFTPQVIDFLSSPQFKTERKGIVSLTTERKLPDEILQKVSYGLTQKDEQDNYIASPIVESIQQSSDQKSSLIKLKKDIYWHNGKNISAEDVKTELPALNIKTTDKLSLYIQTSNVIASLPSFLSKPLLKNNTVGNGEYKISELRYQQGYVKKITLTHVKKQKPNLAYIFYPTIKDAIIALKLGEINEVSTLPSRDEIPPWPNFQVNNTLDTSQYVALYINNEKYDKKMRQALAYATPKTESKKDRALTPIDPNSWAFSPQVKEYNLDNKRAGELFKGNETKKVQILVGDRQLLSVAEFIKRNWHDALGLEVEIISQTSQLSGNYDTFLTKTTIPADPDQYAFWHSTQTSTNITKLNNPLIDRLLEEGRQTTNKQERERIYAEFQKVLLEETPAIFLYYPTTYSVSRIK